MRAITSPTRPRLTPSGLTRTRVRSDTAVCTPSYGEWRNRHAQGSDRPSHPDGIVVVVTTAPEQTEPAKSHAGSALTSAAVLFVLLRLLAVAHYDWHTAFALLHTL